MSEINNDTDFREVLESLDEVKQRQLAALFVEHVLPLATDKRLERVVKIAKDLDATKEEIAGALKTAHAVTFESHARCGAEGHWSDQAGYFVGRAAVAATTPVTSSRPGGPSWQAAMSARIAYTSMLIEGAPGQSAHTECEWQYQALSDLLNAQEERI